MRLRPYQIDLVDRARGKLKQNRCLLVQLCTGAGKTAIFSHICASAYHFKNVVWIVVPRIDLIDQASDHLKRYKVPHGIIQGRHSENRAYQVHVISRETIIRRIRQDKIKKWPSLLIIDEAHIALDQQSEIIRNLPPDAQVLGFTATPELTTGEGLSPPYHDIIYGPSIPVLTSGGYLVPLEYYSPPVESMNHLKRIGTEIDIFEMADFLKAHKIYGQAVEHYEQLARGKTALIFCRSVGDAYDVAAQFRAHGHDFYCIEGDRKNCPDAKRKELLAAARNRELSLVNCDIATYGIDLPAVEYGASLRLTQSRALYFQMIGRIIRPFPGKAKAIFSDHVGLIREHADWKYPDIPPFYVENLEWNFFGDMTRERNESGNLTGGFFKFGEPKQEWTIKTDLEVVQAEYQADAVPSTEKKEIVDRIGELHGNYSPEAVEEVLRIADKFGHSPLWVYDNLNAEKISVNYRLLHAIAENRGYSPWWPKMQANELRRQNATDTERY
jgi:superfamily II DNA or RNA helicase